MIRLPFFILIPTGDFLLIKPTWHLSNILFRPYPTCIYLNDYQSNCVMGPPYQMLGRSLGSFDCPVHRTALLKLKCIYKSPGCLGKMQILTPEVWGGTLRVCISNPLFGDADAAGLRFTYWAQITLVMFSKISKRKYKHSYVISCNLFPER